MFVLGVSAATLLIGTFAGAFGLISWVIFLIIARRLKKFKENLDRPLAAILSLNTAAHTIGAVGVGAQASVIWADSNPLVTAVVIPVAKRNMVLILKLYW